MADYSRFKKYDDAWKRKKMASLTPQEMMDRDILDIIDRRNHLARKGGYYTAENAKGDTGAGARPYWPTPSLDSGNFNPRYLNKLPIDQTPNTQYPEDVTATPKTLKIDPSIWFKRDGNRQKEKQQPVNQGKPMRLEKRSPQQQMTPLEKQMGSVNPWGVRTFKKPEPRYEWKFDPTMRGVKNAGQEVIRQGEGFLGGVNNYFKKLFNDPARLAQIQTSLALMNPNLRYDKGPKGLEVDNPWGAFGKAMQVGQKSYMDAINRPLRYGQNSMGQIFDKQTGKVVSDGLGSAGGYLGTAEFAQNRNILLDPKADTNSPRYRSAYFGEMQRQTRQSIDPTTGQVIMIRPDMSAYRPPSGYVPSGVETQQRERTKPYSDAQMQAGGFYSRMLDATKSLESIYAGPDGMYGTEDDLLPEEVFSNVDLTSTKILGDYGNFFVSEKFQNAKQAMDNWVTANLRKESGAAIPPEEVAREYKKWFPSIGDKPSTIRQKAQA